MIKILSIACLAVWFLWNGAAGIEVKSVPINSKNFFFQNFLIQNFGVENLSQNLFAENHFSLAKNSPIRDKRRGGKHSIPLIRVKIFDQKIDGKISSLFTLKKNHFEIGSQSIRFKNKTVQFKNSIATFETDKHFISVGKNYYNGTLIVIKKKDHLQIINELPINDYLVGVLAGEISYSWPQSAIDAQAISARSYVYYWREQNKNKPYHIISGEVHQVFHGVKDPHPKFVKAVRRTQGQIIIYRREPIQTFFHATCGGTTTKPHLTWGGEEKSKVYSTLR